MADPRERSEADYLPRAADCAGRSPVNQSVNPCPRSRRFGVYVGSSSVSGFASCIWRDRSFAVARTLQQPKER
jgi:hypothetical protein